MDICQCCQRLKISKNNQREWYCLYCDKECTKEHREPTCGIYRFHCINLTNKLYLNTCECCHKIFVVQNENKEWFCFYCSEDNHSNWKCLKQHSKSNSYQYPFHSIMSKKFSKNFIPNTI